MTLDNLLEEEDLDAQSAESIEEGSVVNKNISSAMNTDWEITMKVYLILSEL